MSKLCLLFALLVSFVVGGASMADDASDVAPVRVAAASSLQFALKEIVEAYVMQTGNPAPQIVYGSSGNLFRQIMQGAPFDVFLSADFELIEKLESAEKSQAAAVDIGADQLVLYTNKGPTPDIGQFRVLLDQPENKAFKIAIANPRHAPFGKAAQQAFESLGLWEKVQPRVVFAEKVSQAAQFAASGATEFAVISHSLAVSPALLEAGSFALIPTQHYQPVVQSMVLLAGTKPARALFEFIGGSAVAMGIFQKYGLQ